MNTRDKILKNIKLSTESRNEVLEDVEYSFNDENLLSRFQEALKDASAQFQIFSTFEEAKEIINSTFSENKSCINTVEKIGIDSIDLTQISNPKELHPLDLAIIKGEFGVAENGSIWVNAGDLPDRTIPFICENLVLIIDSDKLVNDMHEAYEKTNNLDYSYGVFITGPSKTADIEQTLVIGAQGARELLVLCKNM